MPTSSIDGPITGLAKLWSSRTERDAHTMLRRVPFDAFGVVLDAAQVHACTRKAAKHFGDTVRAGTPSTALIDALAHDMPDIAQSLHELLRRGAAFRARGMSRGTCLEITGAAGSSACLLTFRDISTAPETMEVAQLRAERDALRRLLDASDRPVWHVAPSDAPLWASEATNQLAAPHDRGIRIPLPDGGALVTADPVKDTLSDPEAILRRFVETVSDTFACLRVGLAIFDRERRLTLSNPALTDLFHADEGWLSGRPTLRETLDRLREARQLPEQADYPAWRATLFTLFDGDGRAYEDVWDLPDGRSLQVVARPHPMGGLVFVFEDITESVALQRWRSTAVEVRRATLDQMADGVVVIGPDGQLRIANPAFVDQWRLNGADLDSWHITQLAEHCGQLCRDVPLWERVRSIVANTVARTPWEGRVSLLDGRILKARATPMPDGSTLVVMADVTDSEHVAAALRDRASALEGAEQMRDALVDHLSHRLRTPLNTIAGFAEMLSVGRVGALSEAQAGFVGHIQEAARQLLAGIESLDDLASIHVPMNATGGGGAVALGAALRGAVGLLARRAEEAGVHLSAAGQTTEAVVWGDTGHIRQAVYRLVSEALALAEPGTRLEAGATSEGEQVVVWCEGFTSAPAEPSPAEIHIETGESGRPRLVSRLPVHAATDSSAS